MQQSSTRILAIDAMSRGFGYVLFEQPFHLAAWGRAYVEPGKPSGLTDRFKELLAEHQPQVLVVEDVKAPGSRRWPRLRRVTDELVRDAREGGIPVRSIPRTAVLKRFSPEGELVTKRAIAELLIKHFPELASELPRPRKMWESESDHMTVFEALALAVTYASE